MGTVTNNPTLNANTWYTVDIPLSDLAAANIVLNGIVFQNVNTGLIYYDDIKLVSNTGSTTTSTNTQYIHTDLLNSTAVVSNASGATQESLAYYPWGGVLSQAGSAASKRNYIGEYQDTLSNLSYLNARYYNGAQGRFISQDPSFLDIGDKARLKADTNLELDQYLQNPQSLNSYSYANDNPTTNKDDKGKFLVEAAIGALVGGVAGLVGQGVSDVITGHPSSVTTYVGAFAGGAVNGGIIGATDGVSLLATSGSGAIGGAVSSLTTQGLDYITDKTYGRQTSAFNSKDLVDQTASGALGGAAGNLLKTSIPGITSGRNSFQAITNQINTKLSNGTINNITASTIGKSVTSGLVNSTSGYFVQGSFNSLTNPTPVY